MFDLLTRENQTKILVNDEEAWSTFEAQNTLSTLFMYTFIGVYFHLKIL